MLSSIHHRILPLLILYAVLLAPPPAPRGMLHPKHGRIRAQGRVQQGRSA